MFDLKLQKYWKNNTPKQVKSTNIIFLNYNMVFNIDQFVKLSDFNFGIHANSLIIMSNFIVMYTVMHQKNI